MYTIKQNITNPGPEYQIGHSFSGQGTLHPKVSSICRGRIKYTTCPQYGALMNVTFLSHKRQIATTIC